MSQPKTAYKLDPLRATIWEIMGGGGPNDTPPPLGIICHNKGFLNNTLERPVVFLL